MNHDACDRRIAELEAEVATLRAVVRYVDHEIECEWGESMAKRIAFDLDDECAAAVRRATEETRKPELGPPPITRGAVT